MTYLPLTPCSRKAICFSLWSTITATRPLKDRLLMSSGTEDFLIRGDAVTLISPQMVEQRIPRNTYYIKGGYDGEQGAVIDDLWRTDSSGKPQLVFKHRSDKEIA